MNYYAFESYGESYSVVQGQLRMLSGGIYLLRVCI
jgi:hypothetical protein